MSIRRTALAPALVLGAFLAGYFARGPRPAPRPLPAAAEFAPEEVRLDVPDPAAPGGVRRLSFPVVTRYTERGLEAGPEARPECPGVFLAGRRADGGHAYRSYYGPP